MALYGLSCHTRNVIYQGSCQPFAVLQQDAVLSTEERRPAIGGQPVAAEEAAALREPETGEHSAAPVAAPPPKESRHAEHLADEIRVGAGSMLGTLVMPPVVEQPEPVLDDEAITVGPSRQETDAATGVAAVSVAADDAAKQVRPSVPGGFTLIRHSVDSRCLRAASRTLLRSLLLSVVIAARACARHDMLQNPGCKYHAPPRLLCTACDFMLSFEICRRAAFPLAKLTSLPAVAGSFT